MVTPRLLQRLHRIGWEFWLPLPLIAALFWLVGNMIALQVLRRPYNSVNRLQVDMPLDAQLPMTLVAITAEIDRSRGVTTVSIKTTDLNAKRLTHEFPVTEISHIEVAIAQKLDLSVEKVRKLISYRIKDEP